MGPEVFPVKQSGIPKNDSDFGKGHDLILEGQQVKASNKQKIPPPTLTNRSRRKDSIN